MPIATIILGVSLLSAAVVVIAWLFYGLGRRRAYQATEELTRLNEIGHQLLRAKLSVDDLCELVYTQAGQIIPTALFQLGLFEGDAYQVKVRTLDGERLPETTFPGGANKGIVGWVRSTGQPLLVRDFEAERDQLPAFPDFELEAPPRSGLFVPLLAGTSTIGVIAVQSRQTARFTEEHLRLVTALANQAALTIRNAQLYERERHRAEQLDLLAQVSAQVSTVQPLPDLFSQIVTLIKETFGYYCASILIYEGSQLQIGASTNQLLPPRTPYVGPGLIAWAAEQRQAALANNVAEDSRYEEAVALPETRSEIALPLKVEDRVLGVLDIQGDQVCAFTEEDVALLETLAAQLALAVEQTQTYQTERRLTQRLEALIQASQAVVSLLDLDDLLEEVVDLIADTFSFERVHIFVRTGNTLSFRAGRGPHGVRWLIDELAYELDEPGLIPRVGLTGEAQLVDDVAQNQDYRPGPGLEDTRSELTVPIKMAGHVMGVIDVQSELADAFSEEDLTLMQSLADSVAVAIRNATLYVNERRRRSLADTLRDISATLVSDLNLDHVLESILEGLSRVVTLDTAAILLVESTTNMLTVAAVTGSVPEGIAGRQLALDLFTPEQNGGLEESVSHVYHSLLNIPLTEHACLSAPLTVGGDLIGYLIVDHHHPQQYSGSDRELVLAFANQAAVALNNARLYSAQQAEAYVTTALLQVAEAINTHAEVDDALDTIARLTALLAGVRRCLILDWNPLETAYHLKAQYGIPPQLITALASEPLSVNDHPFLDLMSVADRPLGAGEGYQLPIPVLLADLLGAPAIIGFPLQAKGEPVGLLIVDDPQSAQSLDPRLLTILTGIAHQTATALEAAILQSGAVERERLEQEINVARNIQASFIPDAPPQAPGWEIAAHWRAARQVGGDFYDFIPLQDGRWGLVVADVADKGIPAALFMAMCRTIIRAVAINRVWPADTLTRVNELIFNDSRSDLFVTVLYAVWDPANGEVVFANGGHNPPLLIRGNELQITELRSNGIALGVLPDIELHEQRLELHSGDILVAYTDGVTEAMQADFTEWGIERFADTLQHSCTQPAQSILENVLTAIDAFVSGAPQSDDLTIWLLKRI